MKIRFAFGRFIDVDRLAVELDLGAVLHAVEVQLDDAALPLRRDVELEAKEPDGVVGLVVIRRRITRLSPSCRER